MWSCDPPALRGRSGEGAMDLSQRGSGSRGWGQCPAAVLRRLHYPAARLRRLLRAHCSAPAPASSSPVSGRSHVGGFFDTQMVLDLNGKCPMFNAHISVVGASGRHLTGVASASITYNYVFMAAAFGSFLTHRQLFIRLGGRRRWSPSKSCSGGERRLQRRLGPGLGRWECHGEGHGVSNVVAAKNL
ncbi:uncharacterized protein LOC123721140 [Papilio machaon]|uniref:uncharacterized protein LOC123721140 n=1 Tax=Papilio machaon TaxID=76193 RepID=UPI001E66551E|nr:uncharacterized protein LOC123721140 [Papilio machaon]